MRIRAKLRIAALAPLLMALVAGAAILLSHRAIWSAQENARTLQRAIGSIGALSGLVGEHMLYHKEQPLRQFLGTHDEIVQTLSTMRLDRTDQQELLSQILRDAGVLRESFAELNRLHEQRSRDERNPALTEAENRAADQVLAQSSQLTTDALRLDRLVDDRISFIQRTTDGVILLLVVAIMLPLTFGLARTMRSINRSLDRLRAGTQQVGAGNLDHRIGMTARDELGELAGFFDGMTEKLQAVTVSRDDLAREIAERRRAEEALGQSEARYAALFEAMTEGFSIQEIILNERGEPADYRFLDVNPAFEKLTGLKRANILGRRVREVLPEIEPHWIETFGRVALTGKPARVENFSAALGRWYEVLAYRPAPGRFAVVFTDVTERKEAEEALRKGRDELEQRVQERTAELTVASAALSAERQRFNNVLDMLPSYVVLLAPDYRVPFANRYFEQRFGKSGGKRCYEYLFHRTEPCENCESFKALKTNAPYHWEWLGPDGRNYDIHDFPFTDSDGSSLILEMGIDITERKKAEAALNELNESLERRVAERTGELQRLNRTLKAHSRSDQALLRAGDEASYLQDVCKIIVEDCGHAMVWVGMAQQDEARSVLPVAHSGFEEGYLDALKVTWADVERGRGPTGTAIRTGRVSLCRNMLTDPAFAPWRAEAVKRGYASSIVLPLMAGGKAFGALNVYSRDPDPFSEEEVNLLTELTGDFAHGITTLRLHVAHARAEKALQERDRSLQQALSVSRSFSFEWEPDGDRVLRSKDCAPILGLSAETAQFDTGAGYFQRVHPDDRARFLAMLRALSPQAHTYRTTYRLTRPDGQTIILEEAGQGYFDEAGKLRRLVGITTDVTQRERAEEALRKTAEQLNRAQEIAHLGSWEMDLVHDRLSWSDEVYRIFGLQPQEFGATYEAFLEAVHPEDRDAVDLAYSSSLRDGRDSYEVEHRVVRKSTGEVRFVHEKCGHFRDASGRIVRSVGMVQDITERKRAEAQLREMNETLEQRVAERTQEIGQLADQLRALASELSQTEQRERKRLATILHDHIQQLLVAAQMQLTLVRRAEKKTIESAVQGVESIIKEAISASRSLTVELSPPILHQAGLGAALGWLAGRMEEKSLFKVHLRASSDAEPADEAVRLLLFESVRELLLNAVKYSGVREARVTMTRTRDGWTRIVVEDEGNGFDAGSLKPRSGAGFGLFSIQQRLAYLGGRMDVVSAPGHGARVVLASPPGMAQPGAPGVAPAADGAGAARFRAAGKAISVLLVDDHMIMRQGLVGLLQFEQDMEVVGEAANGREAVDLARKLHPAVIVMDINMPVMDGVEATRIIAKEMPQIKVIGLSMHVDANVAAAMREAGACGYLTKGGPSEDLISAIRACAVREPER